MLEKVFLDVNKLFNKFEFKPVVVYQSATKHCCISCRTFDDKVFAYAESNEDGYEDKEFAIRDWSIMNSILGTFSGDNEDKLKVKLVYNDYNYPHLATFSAGRLKVNHYLQSYNMISSQQDLLNNYSKKKLNLKEFSGEGDNYITDEVVKNISKMSSLLGEKTFRLKSTNEGIFALFGNENQTIDNGLIQISDIVENIEFKDNMYFSVEYFINMFKAMSINEEYKIKVFPDKIVFCGRNDVTSKVGIVVGSTV